MEQAEQAREILLALGAGAVGTTHAQPILSAMAVGQQEVALRALPGLCSLLCGVFPYYNDGAPGNLSLYARGQDYHKVVGTRLQEACRRLGERFPGYSFVPYVDVSPYPEVLACAWAGLGLLGQNGLLLTEKWGSYVFCGLIATDLPLPQGQPPRGCENCGRCQAACPGKALEKGRVEPQRCLSALSQQRGDLPAESANVLARQGMAWGCDQCQRVCPHNRAPQRSTLEEFTQDTLCSLTLDALEGLSDRAFRRLYQQRAFSWRGIAPLRRNLEQLAQRSIPTGGGPMEDKVFEDALQFVAQQFEACPTHRQQFSYREKNAHTRRVFRLAQRLLEGERANRDVVLMAAAFHDVGYTINVGNHMAHSARICREYLTQRGFALGYINQVCQIIENHNDKELIYKADTSLEQILVIEADNLDEKGAASILRDALGAGANPQVSYSAALERIEQHPVTATKILRACITPTARKIWKQKQREYYMFLEALRRDLGK